MNTKKILKICLNAIFIPLISFFSIGIIMFIFSNFQYFLVSLIIDFILIISYRALKNKISNSKIEENFTKIKHTLDKKNEIKREKNTDKNKETVKENMLHNYNKLADNLYINNTEKKIKIDNHIFNFSDILDVKLVENGYESMLGAGIRNSNLIVGHKKERINQLDIEIKVNSIDNPFFSIPFLKLGIHLGFYKTTKKYKDAYKQAQHCLSILEMIVENNRKIIER